MGASVRQALLSLFVALAACSANTDSDALANMVVENLTAENLVIENDMAGAEAAAAPEPRYIEKDGDTYLYVAAVSEEDQKRGRVAGSIIGFRYLGKTGDVYRLQGPDASSSVHECTRPCRVIKSYRSGGIVTRTEFTPSSIIGAAFVDAFNGFLNAVPPPRSAEPTPLPYADASDAENEETDASIDEPPSNEVENEVMMNTTQDF